jgi:membrane-bound lytic murein transglycosylase D
MKNQNRFYSIFVWIAMACMLGIIVLIFINYQAFDAPIKQIGNERALDKNEKSSQRIIQKEEKKNRKPKGFFSKIRPLDYKLVEKYVDYYTRRDREYFMQSLYRMRLFYKTVRKYQKKYDLPPEMLLLGIVESGYKSTALSHDGARGVWQLMPGTARMLGLRVDSKVDERLDVAKSTDAAFRYLKELEKMFRGDWLLVISAYNTGWNRVRKLIEKYNTRNFRRISSKRGFEEETRRLVSKFLAVLHIIRNPERYGIKSPFVLTLAQEME